MSERERETLFPGKIQGVASLFPRQAPPAASPSPDSVLSQQPVPRVLDLREILCHPTQSGLRFFLGVKTTNGFPQPFFFLSF